MIQVTANDWKSGEVLDVVKELRNRGYVQGTDFDFEYFKPKHDYISGHLEYNRHTVFSFYTESLATWFSLTYL
jgi:hypothetical protein